MNNTFGLRKNDLEVIISVLQQHPEISEACFFGSRAKGNYHNGSDVDLALKGHQLNEELIWRISYQLNEETILPYQFDVLNYHSISNDDLKEHIDRAGIAFYHNASGQA